MNGGGASRRSVGRSLLEAPSTTPSRRPGPRGRARGHVPELRRGALVWLDLDPVKGREQAGHRPALVIASDAYLATATTLVIVVPVTSIDRGWPNHIRLGGDEVGLDRTSFATTEQPRTIDRGRVTAVAGSVDDATMREVDLWLRDFLGL